MMKTFEIPDDHLVLVIVGPRYSGKTTAATGLHRFLTGQGAGLGFVPEEQEQTGPQNILARVEDTLYNAENYSLTIVDGLEKKSDAVLLLGALGTQLHITHLAVTEKTQRNRLILEAEKNHTPLHPSALQSFGAEASSDPYLASDVYAMANTPPTAIATDYLRPAEITQKILEALRTPARV